MTSNRHHKHGSINFGWHCFNMVLTKVKNIGFDGYIVLRFYRYISGYFYINIDISKINKNTLKFMETLSKSVKRILIIKYTH